jgi:hypothetical protein
MPPRAPHLLRGGALFLRMDAIIAAILAARLIAIRPAPDWKTPSSSRHEETSRRA